MFNAKKNTLIGSIKMQIEDWFEETDGDVYIECRDLNVEEYCKIAEAKDDENKSLLAFKEVLPNIILKHNFYEEEDKQMSNDEVVKVLWNKAMLFKSVFTQYLTFSFRLPKANKL